MPAYPSDETADRAAFTAVMQSSKGKVIEREQLTTYVAEHFAEAKTIVSTVDGIKGNLDPTAIEDPLQLAGVDLAVLHGQFAVAENGAIWVSESEAVVRVLPFITQHLILLIDGPIVPTMHEAYQRIKVDDTGFGVFIAGPSKTADIEQSLVIGAHGPRSLVVVL
jgi:L-lactate dehydrogenase complex protein LldG